MNGRKYFNFFALLILLSCGDRNKYSDGKCTKLRISAFFYKGESVHVLFNDKSIIKQKYAKNRMTSKDTCIMYKEAFSIKVKIEYNNATILDTIIKGLPENNDQLLLIPIALPLYVISPSSMSKIDSMNYWMSLPPDHLRRRVILKPAK